ncbi:hypothetical protein K3495_g14466 [Podosphaera aphanis]|nr:hypothetical protein K3495_g14466 [Podosphaera aphanis]
MYNKISLLVHQFFVKRERVEQTSQSTLAFYKIESFQFFMAANEIALRTIHLKLYPSPKLFSHRREVLRIISTYGEVTAFRSLKYHPVDPISNAFIAVFATPSAAQELYNASPVNYHVIPDTQSPEASTSTSNAIEKQEFSLNISVTNFSHEQFISSRFTNPLHGPFFPTIPKMSFIGSALSQHIDKNSISASGLLDWETDRGRGLMRVRNSRLTDTPGKFFRKAMRREESKTIPSTY